MAPCVEPTQGICLQASDTPFPKCVSYSHFVELEGEVLLGTCTGISFVDFTPLRVCRNQRILIHKTFEDLAERGKCSMGWFFGFKLYLIINDKGEILNFMFTPGNVDDREPLKQKRFLKNIKKPLQKSILHPNHKISYTDYQQIRQLTFYYWSSFA